MTSLLSSSSSSDSFFSSRQRVLDFHPHDCARLNVSGFELYSSDQKYPIEGDTSHADTAAGGTSRGTPKFEVGEDFWTFVDVSETLLCNGSAFPLIFGLRIALAVFVEGLACAPHRRVVEDRGLVFETICSDRKDIVTIERSDDSIDGGISSEMREDLVISSLEIKADMCAFSPLLLHVQLLCQSPPFAVRVTLQ